MTCCGSATGLEDFADRSREEIALASKALGNDLRQTMLSVPGMHCAACMQAIEKSLSSLDGVRTARANLTRRLVTVTWSEADGTPDLVGALGTLGYESNLPGEAEPEADKAQAHLVRALAVAGFCSMNIMLLAVSVWSGADPGTRHSFQILSAALALPAVIYSGSSFYVSAFRALSSGRLNMDVPISAGVLLSFAMSLYDALTNAAPAYFEAATSLLFVLLAGRLLDYLMRAKARSAVSALARLMPQGADVIADDDSVDHVALADVRADARILVVAGARVPTDGVVLKGRSKVDASMISGESRYRTVDVGDEVKGGEINQGNPFEFRALVAPSDSLLSEMTRLLAEAEDGRTRYRRLADRAAAFYAPVVHSLSALAFAVWLYATSDVHQALTIGIAVLVITCPCALGLAVPMVQVALARRLHDNGVLVTDGTAFERLASIDTVVFDKTGTLTTGEPALSAAGCSGDDLAVAGSLAAHSTHPFSRALAKEAVKARLTEVPFSNVEEVPGFGLEGHSAGAVYRLGRPGWAGGDGELDHDAVVLSRDGVRLASFRFSERLRPGAAELVRSLGRDGVAVRILSGDSREAVALVAAELGIQDHVAQMLPGEKVEAIRRLQAHGRKVLMVGDGVNDAAALKAADVSMVPSSASNIGRSSVDFVFLSRNLSVVAESILSSRRAMTLIRQNFALAAVYNLASLPLAFAGYVTPLVAALAMSTSSLLVVSNSLRLALPVDRDRKDSPELLVAEARA